MKHHDLWNDSLDEAMPPDLVARSLKAMQRAARGRKQRRRITCAALLGLACAAAGALVFWPSPHPKQSGARAVANAAPAPASPVRYLSDDELIEHLNAAGYGITITKKSGHEQMLLVPHVVKYRPKPPLIVLHEHHS